MEIAATAATICVLLQLSTVPRVLPSQIFPLPCADPKPEPEIVTGVPAAPVDGETEVMLGIVGGAGEANTVTEVVPCVPPKVAVTVAVPAFAPRAKPGRPVLAINKVVTLDVLHVTLPVKSCTLLSENVPEAVNCWPEPMITEGFAGAIVKETSPAALSVADPPISPAVAVKVVVPVTSAFTIPAFPGELLIEATEGFDEFQMTD